MTCVFGLPTENWTRFATITAGDQVTGLGPGNLATDQGATSAAWQTPVGVTESFVRLEMPAAVEYGAFGLFNTNLTESAVIRWRVGDDAFLASPTLNSFNLTGTVSDGYRQSVYVPPAPASGIYMLVNITDTGNPEGCIRVGQMFAGIARRPVRAGPVGLASSMARGAVAPVITTRGGQDYPELHYVRRAWRVVLPTLAAADTFRIAQDVQRAAESGGNVLFVPFPAGANQGREAVFGTVAGSAPVGWPGASSLIRSWAATITERL